MCLSFLERGLRRSECELLARRARFSLRLRRRNNAASSCLIQRPPCMTEECLRKRPVASRQRTMAKRLWKATRRHG